MFQNAVRILIMSRSNSCLYRMHLINGKSEFFPLFPFRIIKFSNQGNEMAESVVKKVNKYFTVCLSYFLNRFSWNLAFWNPWVTWRKRIRKNPESGKISWFLMFSPVFNCAMPAPRTTIMKDFAKIRNMNIFFRVPTQTEYRENESKKSYILMWFFF